MKAVIIIIIITLNHCEVQRRERVKEVFQDHSFLFSKLKEGVTQILLNPCPAPFSLKGEAEWSRGILKVSLCSFWVQHVLCAH